MTAVKVLLAAGLFLVLVGVGFVGYQMTFIGIASEDNPKEIRYGEFSLKTHYPGVIIIGIGAVLLIVAAGADRRSD